MSQSCGLARGFVFIEQTGGGVACCDAASLSGGFVECAQCCGQVSAGTGGLFGGEATGKVFANLLCTEGETAGGFLWGLVPPLVPVVKGLECDVAFLEYQSALDELFDAFGGWFVVAYACGGRCG